MHHLFVAKFTAVYYLDLGRYTGFSLGSESILYRNAIVVQQLV